jgi:hypothetical protein
MCYDVREMNSQYKLYYIAAVIGVCITLLFICIVLFHYRSISISAPGAPIDLTAKPTSQSAGGDPNQFTVAPDTIWEKVTGNVYPYSFSSPITLSLATFPDDKYDMYAIVWKGQPADQNVLMGVDNLKNDAARSHFISKPKITYVREWYKQFGLKGVSSIVEFTNSNGLKGYKAKYFNSAGVANNTDVFFEVPGNPQYVVHFASGVLAPDVFDKMIDSVNWESAR